jgi:hypothetical protein
MKVKYYLIIIALFLTSCAPIYIPNNVNTPLLSKKHEATFNIGAGLNGADVQLSYAVSDDIGLLLNGSYLSDENKNHDGKNITYQEQQKYIEAAIGTFGSASENVVMEAYAGGGYGKSASIDSYLLNNSKKIYGEGEFYKLFLQTDIGLKGKILEGGVALRCAYIRFDKLRYETDFQFDKSLEGFFFEPAVFMRFGGPIFKIQTQVGFSTKLNRKEFLIYEPLILSIGFIIRINTNL